VLFDTLLPLVVIIVVIVIVAVTNNSLFATLSPNEDVIVVDIDIVTIIYDMLLATL
jgi:hypothetical protein